MEVANQRTDQIMKLIILMAKNYIYKCKFQDRFPQTKEFMKILYERFLMEKSFSSSKGENPNRIVVAWANYLALFQGLDVNAL